MSGETFGAQHDGGSNRTVIGRIFEFVFAAIKFALTGSMKYYAWLGSLSIVLLFGLFSYALVLMHGGLILGPRNPTPWGLYIALFPFFVELATGAIIVMVLAYLFYDGEEFRQVSVFAGAIALAGVAATLVSVLADLGRVGRMPHILPGIGTMHFPESLFAWDTLVLNGYILIVGVIFGHMLYRRYHGMSIKRWATWLLFLAVPWAMGILLVDPFIFSAVAARPSWSSALMAPRFYVGAFAVAPALLILVLQGANRYLPETFSFPADIYERFSRVMLLAVLVNILFVVSELFVGFYTGTGHSVTYEYLLFGLEHNGVVYNTYTPLMWVVLGLHVVAATLLLLPQTRSNLRYINAAAVSILAMMIIDKLLLVVAAFIVGPLGGIHEYIPTLPEVMIGLSFFALGALVFTVLLKAAAGIEDATSTAE